MRTLLKKKEKDFEKYDLVFNAALEELIENIFTYSDFFYFIKYLLDNFIFLDCPTNKNTLRN
ncbi:MAG: hypothetical protein EAZ97_15795 [Bacteroidetes bacterium]|nr:MAG: hypothetical protein EAZ97_15795 [Bacteroidota bacterium]